MGKRSPGAFPRNKHDLYRTTDPAAVRALMPHIEPGARFVEPCAGHGDLVFGLIEQGLRCVGALDIEPQPNSFWLAAADEPEEFAIVEADARGCRAAKQPAPFEYWITNPPWTRDILHAIILNLYWQRPTWLLFDAAWAHTEQARPFMPLCRKIVAVGRMRWFEGTPDKGKDDIAWYLFAPAGGTQFIGRLG